MKRLMTPAMTIAAALALGACGGGSGSDSAGTSGAAPSKTVSVRELSGVGSVLVDTSGKALYSSDQEAGGKIICDAACTAFWKPVEAGQAALKAASGAGKLGVIKRPDGGIQLTANGRPLYTFAEDSPGKATGNGFTDDFGGHHFIWHVIRAGGISAGGTGGSSGNSTPNSTGTSNGGYGGYG